VKSILSHGHKERNFRQHSPRQDIVRDLSPTKRVILVVIISRLLIPQIGSHYRLDESGHGRVAYRDVYCMQFMSNSNTFQPIFLTLRMAIFIRQRNRW
jgi:hypothetical protein